MAKTECIAMLLAGGQGSRLGILTKNIAKPAVPYGGKYRIIDFLLTDKKDLYHYLVNGNGMIYDELNKKSSWNGKAQAAVRHTTSGWSAELTIPLDEFNASEFNGDFCAGSRPGILYHLYRWGKTGTGFGPAASMKLGTTSEAFRMDGIGEPEFGKLNLTGSGSRGGELKISRDGEKSESLPIPAGKFSLAKRLSPGRQMLEVTSGSLFYWHKEITARNPLGLSFDFDYRTHELAVALDLSSAGDAIQKSMTGNGVFAELSL